MVTNLLIKGETIAGVKLMHKGKEIKIRSDLVLGADGSSSIVRLRTGTINTDNIIAVYGNMLKIFPQPMMA